MWTDELWDCWCCFVVSYLLFFFFRSKSFMMSTVAATAVAFVAGALSWWGPKFIQLGLATQEQKDIEMDEYVVANIQSRWFYFRRTALPAADFASLCLTSALALMPRTITKAAANTGVRARNLGTTSPMIRFETSNDQYWNSVLYLYRYRPE